MMLRHESNRTNMGLRQQLGLKSRYNRAGWGKRILLEIQLSEVSPSLFRMAVETDFTSGN